MNPIGVVPTNLPPSPQATESGNQRTVSTSGAAPAQKVQMPEKAVEPVGKNKDPEALKSATERLSKIVNSYSNNDLEFSVDSESKEPVVKIVDRVSKEVIRQMPSEEMLKIARNIDKMVGVLLNQKA